MSIATHHPNCIHICNTRSVDNNIVYSAMSIKRQCVKSLDQSSTHSLTNRLVISCSIKGDSVSGKGIRPIDNYKGRKVVYTIK